MARVVLVARLLVGLRAHFLRQPRRQLRGRDVVGARRRCRRRRIRHAAERGQRLGPAGLALGGPGPERRRRARGAVGRAPRGVNRDEAAHLGRRVVGREALRLVVEELAERRDRVVVVVASDARRGGDAREGHVDLDGVVGRERRRREAPLRRRVPGARLAHGRLRHPALHPRRLRRAAEAHVVERERPQRAGAHVGEELHVRVDVRLVRLEPERAALVLAAALVEEQLRGADDVAGAVERDAQERERLGVVAVERGQRRHGHRPHARVAGAVGPVAFSQHLVEALRRALADRPEEVRVDAKRPDGLRVLFQRPRVEVRKAPVHVHRGALARRERAPEVHARPRVRVVAVKPRRAERVRQALDVRRRAVGALDAEREEFEVHGFAALLVRAVPRCAARERCCELQLLHAAAQAQTRGRTARASVPADLESLLVSLCR